VEIMLGIRRGNAFRHMAPHHRPTQQGDPARSRVSTGDRAGVARDRPGSPSIAEAWEPPVFLTAASNGEGVEEVVEAVERHAVFLAASGELARRRRERLERLTREVVDRTLRQLVWNGGSADAALAAGLDDVVRGETSPYQLAHAIVAGVAKGANHGG